jgi:imidazolonepropionase-like amidohydrolase
MLAMLTGHAAVARAQEREPAAPPAPVTVFKGVRIFDGRSNTLKGPADVLVRGNVIERISTTPLAGGAVAGATVIDGKGRTLMPGLIDAHAHILFASLQMPVLLAGDVGYANLVAVKTAESLLMQGVTSVRDLGGPTFSLKKAVDQGLFPGPRIFPSGAFISQTGGHGDFRMPFELSRQPNNPVSISEAIGASRIADGEDAVLRVARENLALGASQLKLMAGGGVTSAYDPLDVSQYSEREFRAAVEAAENWGTYVTVHAYTPRAIQAALRAGVKCIDHGQLADEETARMIAEKGAFWSLQPFLDDEDAVPLPAGQAREKQLEMTRGTETAYKLAKQHGIKIAFGSDALFDPNLVARTGKQLAKIARWFTPAEVLAMATSVNGDLLALSGRRNPYAGKLGVVEEGALADLLLVDGDPLADINLVADPAKRFLVIMKDGKLYKNTTGK